SIQYSRSRSQRVPGAKAGCDPIHLERILRKTLEAHLAARSIAAEPGQHRNTIARPAFELKIHLGRDGPIRYPVQGMVPAFQESGTASDAHLYVFRWIQALFPILVPRSVEPFARHRILVGLGDRGRWRR